MSKNTHTLTAADFAAILSSTLALAAEAGLMIGVRNAAANEKRPDGLMIFIRGRDIQAVNVGTSQYFQDGSLLSLLRR